jgi:hypothetical protein
MATGIERSRRPNGPFSRPRRRGRLHLYVSDFDAPGTGRAFPPFRAPQANAFAERWVGTVRRDCLDWLLISSRRQLERVLRVYVDHYNTHRPHRALGLTPPIPGPRPSLVGSNPRDHLHRRDRLGGLIHEYARAA